MGHFVVPIRLPAGFSGDALAIGGGGFSVLFRSFLVDENELSGVSQRSIVAIVRCRCRVSVTKITSSSSSFRTIGRTGPGCGMSSINTMLSVIICVSRVGVSFFQVFSEHLILVIITINSTG